MYTINALESVNSFFRKVMKQGAFHKKNALFKLLYLRINELYAKLKGTSIQNRVMVRDNFDLYFRPSFVL